jgi:DNA-binding NtrC family response regulator
VDLRSSAAQGRFREGLFHPPNVVRVHVPSLRERKDDIVHPAEHLPPAVRRPSPAGPAHNFTTGAETPLEAYAWPGSVRELRNVVSNSVLLGDAAEVDVEDL